MNMKKIQLNITRKAYRILSIGSAAISAFMLYIIFYAFTDGADYKSVASLAEKSMAFLVIMLAIALMVNYYEVNKEKR